MVNQNYLSAGTEKKKVAAYMEKKIISKRPKLPC